MNIFSYLFLITLGNDLGFFYCTKPKVLDQNLVTLTDTRQVLVKEKIKKKIIINLVIIDNFLLEKYFLFQRCQKFQKVFIIYEKILDKKDLPQQFINDKSILQQKQLADRYSISISTVQRLVKKQNLLNNLRNNHKINLQNNHKIILKNYLKFLIKKVQNMKFHLKNLSKIIHKRTNKLLINILLIISTNQMIRLRFKKRKEKMEQSIIKPQIIQQPQTIIIQQPIQQIDLQQNGEDKSEIKSYMIKIRKFIQFFSKEESIFHIIGSTEFQQRQFISRLFLKNFEELKLIHKSIEFELLFSISNSFVQDSIEFGVLFIERLLLTIDINIVGVYQEMQQDEEFQFYINMYLCESSYIASAKQILFLKFIKNYSMQHNCLEKI